MQHEYLQEHLKGCSCVSLSRLKQKVFFTNKTQLFFIQLQKCIFCTIKLNKAYTTHNYNNIIASLSSDLNMCIQNICALSEDMSLIYFCPCCYAVIAKPMT